MIVKFWKPGSSFKSLVQYLTHDTGRAATAERLGWTHTLNLANDDVGGAVNEMLWTYRNAEFFKLSAGVHGGGRKVEKPVKHLSLAWHPSEAPTKAEMIKAAEGFLRHMGWQNQTIIVAHTDRKHPHLHLAINVAGDDGRALDDSFERRRAQKWALGYEQARGKIFCEERLKPVAEREPSPPRNVWKLLEEARGAYERAEAARIAETSEARDARLMAETLEWRALKELQKEERIGFFDAGKPAYKSVRNQVYREVRRAFAPNWSACFRAERAGADANVIAAVKADLIERQRIVLETRRDAACEKLRLMRDVQYRTLLDRQKAERGELLRAQERNLSSVERLALHAERGEAAARAANQNAPNQNASRNAPADTLADQLPRQASRPAPAVRWSQNAGMVAQESSAQRYLDRLAQRARREAETGASASTRDPIWERLTERAARGTAWLTAPPTAATPSPDGRAASAVGSGRGVSHEGGRGIEPGSD